MSVADLVKQLLPSWGEESNKVLAVHGTRLARPAGPPGAI
jgi:hypothetical protein